MAARTPFIVQSDAVQLGQVTDCVLERTEQPLEFPEVNIIKLETTGVHKVHNES